MSIQKFLTGTIDVSSLTSDDDGKRVAVDANNALALIASDSPFFDLPKFTYTGSVAGYTAGGRAPPTMYNTVDKYPFSSDTNATDVGDLTIARNYYAGQSSTTHGYETGGLTSSSQETQKFPFSSDENATGNLFDLSIKRYGGVGCSSSTHGYHAGGYTVPGQPVPATQQNIIDKFPFSSDENATDVGDLTVARAEAGAGFSFNEAAYAAGGSPATDVINRWSTVSDGNATDVGELIVAVNGGSGSSSGTHGYHCGGDDGSISRDEISKFSFTSNSPATDIAELSRSASFIGGGTSSTTNGYSVGGRPRPSVGTNIIDKFPFSSDSPASDIGNLTVARLEVASNQSGITPIA